MSDPIYTIGYGSRTVEELIATVRRYGIEYVIDVRSQPYSRFKPEFNKSTLEVRLSSAGLRYVFMGDALGGRPADRDCYDQAGKVDYEKVRAKPFYEGGIERLRTALRRNFCVALLCSEGKPQECHRSKLIGVTLHEEGVTVLHIDETGATRTQEEVMTDLTGGQLTLFGPHTATATSRKAYDRDQGSAISDQ
jgi:uncharacterized protein (DUF488 family)